MENIKESLLMAMLENQCRIMAKIDSIERRLNMDLIIKYRHSDAVVEQFKTIDANIETDFKKILAETYNRAEKIEKELSRGNTVIQDL